MLRRRRCRWWTVVYEVILITNSDLCDERTTMSATTADVAVQLWRRRWRHTGFSCWYPLNGFVFVITRRRSLCGRQQLLLLLTNGMVNFTIRPLRVVVLMATTESKSKHVSTCRIIGILLKTIKAWNSGVLWYFSPYSYSSNIYKETKAISNMDWHEMKMKKTIYLSSSTLTLCCMTWCRIWAIVLSERRSDVVWALHFVMRWSTNTHTENDYLERES